MKSSDVGLMITNIFGIKGESMSNPRINQCMSCKLFIRRGDGADQCMDGNNSPYEEEFCYDYQDIEAGEEDVTGE